MKLTTNSKTHHLGSVGALLYEQVERPQTTDYAQYECVVIDCILPLASIEQR